MADSNRNYSQRPHGENHREENPGGAANFVDNPRHSPRRFARPIYEETPAAHAQHMFGYQEIPRYGRPSRRFLRHVAYLNARIFRETASAIQNPRHYQPADPQPPRRSRPQPSPPPNAQCELPPQGPPLPPHPRGSAAYNYHVPPRHRFRGPIGRYANTHFGPGQQSHGPNTNPAVNRGDNGSNDQPGNVSEDSGIVSMENQVPHRQCFNPHYEACYAQPQFRGPAGYRRWRHGGYYNPIYNANPQGFYHPHLFVPQVQEPESIETPFASDDVPRELPAAFNPQFPQSVCPVYEPATDVNAAGPSQHEPVSPYYEGGGSLWSYRNSVVDYCPPGCPVPYPFDQPPMHHPTSMLVPRPPATNYIFTSAQPGEQPPYPPYYSSPSTSFSQLHTSIAYPYTYPYTGNFYPQTPRPFHPFHETTYYPPNLPMTYFYPPATPAMHYPVYPANIPYPNPNYSEATGHNIVPVRMDTPAAPRSVSSSEGNVSPPPSTPPSQRNLQLLPSERTGPAAAGASPQTPGQNSFIHTFVPSTRYPPRSMAPPFTFIGIASESRCRQITGNLYYFCDVPSGRVSSEPCGPEYFLYECSTCPAAAQPCQQWVMVTPRRSPMPAVTAPANLPTTGSDAAHVDAGAQPNRNS